MFLLFLIGLGTAHVNAQVRIGGNAAPNGAAVLDLNATDAATGTKGLALPRVRLDSTKMQITTGVANLNGMMVYNTTATLGAGIYFWNGTAWVKASLPSTSLSDSGKILVSNGSQWIASSTLATVTRLPDTATLTILTDTTLIVRWTKILDTTINVPSSAPGTVLYYPTPGMRYSDLCIRASGNNSELFMSGTNTLMLTTYAYRAFSTPTSRVICYRPSI